MNMLTESSMYRHFYSPHLRRLSFLVTRCIPPFSVQSSHLSTTLLTPVPKCNPNPSRRLFTHRRNHLLAPHPHPIPPSRAVASSCSWRWINRAGIGGMGAFDEVVWNRRRCQTRGHGEWWSGGGRVVVGWWSGGEVVTGVVCVDGWEVDGWMRWIRGS